MEIDHKAVGARLREARKARGFTLMQLSSLSGIAVSTISKAERGDIALTYDKFAALAHALSIDFDVIFGKPERAKTGRMEPSLTRSGEQMTYDTPLYEYGMIANDLTGKRMVPVRGRIHARSLGDFPEFIRHGGEEFLFVLGGELQLHFEDGTVYALSRGDSLYFDSAVGHAYISVGDDDADVLVCCVDADPVRSPEVL